MGYSPHGQLKSSLRKNLSLYLPIGIWLTIVLVALTCKELECPRYLSQNLPLAYVGSRGLLSSLHSFKKYCSFRLDTWKVIFQLKRMSSHLLFLLNFQNDLQGKIGRGLKCLVLWQPLDTKFNNHISK